MRTFIRLGLVVVGIVVLTAGIVGGDAAGAQRGDARGRGEHMGRGHHAARRARFRPACHSRPAGLGSKSMILVSGCSGIFGRK
jgi:hypothetical protein